MVYGEKSLGKGKNLTVFIKFKEQILAHLAHEEC